MLSILLEMKGKSVLVVGGGPVGRRKALTVATAGASVRLLALEPPPADFPPHQAIDWRVEPFRSEHLEGMHLAFAAASIEVNGRVVDEARLRGIWVNSAAGPEGDFELPAVLKRGMLTLSVSTEGAAPAFARRVRDRLEQDLDSAVVEFVALLGEMRTAVLTHVEDPVRRRELLDRWSDWAWLARCRAEGMDTVRTAMWKELDEKASR